MEELKSGRLDNLVTQGKHAKGTSRSRTKERSSELLCPIPGIDDEGLCYALASITPVLGVGEECLDQSVVYLTELFNVSGTKTEDSWAWKSMRVLHAEAFR